MTIAYLPGFEPDLDEWTSDDWETPTDVAKAIASLVQPHELDILEPCAGSGQIAGAIAWHPQRLVTAIEIKPGRTQKGKDRCHWVKWASGDFLAVELTELFDLAITNPPFSLRFEVIRRSLQLLKPEGRLLFLMPIDFNCGKAAGNEWKTLDCHIHHTYRIQNRIAYLDANGKPQNGRQIYDAVFDIRRGKTGATSTFLGNL